MRKHVLLLLMLLTGWSAWAQPPVKLTALLESPRGNSAIVSTSQNNFLIVKGDKLGDYRVDDISHDLVVMSFSGQHFKIAFDTKAAHAEVKLPPEALHPSGPEDTISLRLQGIDRVWALKLLAKDMHQNIWFGPSCAPDPLNLQVNGGSRKGIFSVLSGSGRLESRRLDSILVLGTAEQVANAPAPIPGQSDVEGQVKFDFVNADLVYVLSVLAKEMKRNLIVGPGVEGSVTITTETAVPTGQLLQLLVGGQDEHLEAALDKHFLVVGKSLPAVVAPSAEGPRFSFQPKEPWEPVDLSDVVAKVATQLKLKPVLPANFKGTVYLSLEGVPALLALERILALNGYRFHVDKGSLIITK